MRIFTSVSVEWPNSAALAAAMSTEIAMSPSNFGLCEGNVNTSVGSFMRRYSRLSFRISSLEVTKITMSPRSPTARCAFPANSASARSRTSGSSCSRRSIFSSRRNGRAYALPHHDIKFLFGNAILHRRRRFRRRHFRQRGLTADARGIRLSIAPRKRITVAVLHFQGQRQLLVAALVIVIGADDALHQVVPHDVAFIEVAKANPVNVLQDIDHFQKSAAVRIRQINLRDVAGDDGFRVEPETGHEHLHLLGSGILRLVKNDERIVQGPPAHERDGRDLDDVLLQITVYLVGLEHVVERVVQRPKIRVNFFL